MKAAPPPQKTGIQCKMVVSVKVDDMGIVFCFTVRLVARRFFQKEGQNCFETFAPVVPFEVLLSLVWKFVSEAWLHFHANIYTAFLNAKIDGELYFSWDDVIYKLQNSLCGPKQSPRIWYEKLKKIPDGI